MANNKKQETVKFEKMPKAGSYNVKASISEAQRKCIAGLNQWLEGSIQSSKGKMIEGPL